MRDSALIASARKVEHFEIAGYGSLCVWAGLLGESKIKALLLRVVGGRESRR